MVGRRYTARLRPHSAGRTMPRASVVTSRARNASVPTSHRTRVGRVRLGSLSGRLAMSEGERLRGVFDSHSDYCCGAIDATTTISAKAICSGYESWRSHATDWAPCRILGRGKTA